MDLVERRIVKLTAPQFVKPCVRANKNDAADSQATCEAVARMNMRFVPVKSIEQQSTLALELIELIEDASNELTGGFRLLVPCPIAPRNPFYRPPWQG